MTDLSQLVIVVTGATGALGPAVVRRAAGAGAHVVAAGRDETALAELASATDGSVSPSTVDLADEQATLAWGHELVEQYGRVDGLLHLVGGWRGGKGIVESDLADWDVLHASLIQTLQHASRALHDPIRDSPRGRLAIVSSTGVARPRAKNASYAAAKAAAEAWTLAVADSFSGTQAAASVVRVMALLTPQMREARPDAAFKNYRDVDDVAAQLVSLWDSPAAEVNGAIL
ncbi:SDR family NAD(P)-dependent oxidoreductase [Allobranchiibius sp. CTAmp26]|uniref:SDR family NAD(P)-dependent oxidoreductase n=1 Tax=Allobranchiibius sp. CTAmp26 TaxID=2815214 RepID=UPI001AA11A68|nr:SDR family NAD(P)-dependent oxidoreductase [Allobranchiibius sp. CTAmp26]MBO1753606.1 SDR family NAD(P)-dependent oxidoreductase [Allobranchiibius sp. CTAmp26]